MPNLFNDSSFHSFEFLFGRRESDVVKPFGKLRSCFCLAGDTEMQSAEGTKEEPSFKISLKSDLLAHISKGQ